MKPVAKIRGEGISRRNTKNGADTVRLLKGYVCVCACVYGLSKAAREERWVERPG